MFQFNATHIFLTYAQCTLTKEAILAHLLTLHPDAIIRVGTELHEDLGTHHHCLIRVPSPFRTRNERYWDIEHHHPHVQSARNSKKVWTYCGKDGCIIDHGNWTFPEGKKSWSEALGAPTKDEFMEEIKTDHPRDYILNYERLQYFTNHHYANNLPEYVHDNNLAFITPNALDTWWEEVINPGNISSDLRPSSFPLS